ncbi:putative te1b-like protein [Erysiphe necator]|uniref:Putative te1b-like protein n=1 Tax=Uncinula necator TaxID=52586 RepID=A0A0B1P5X8_UNCNE|nr:putative te1b-like protein [Erysiphe necator]
MPGAEACDAEIFGAFKALVTAVETDRSNPIKLLLDCRTTVRALCTGQAKTSQAKIDMFLDLAQTCRDLEVKWIPSHSKIYGNVTADKLAKSALTQLPAESITNFDPSRPRGETKYSIAALTRYVRDQTKIEIKLWWRNHKPRRYRELELEMDHKQPPELTLPRWAYHRLVAARIGHGDFSDYHERFKHVNIDDRCVCGRERRPWHFAECRLAQRKWRDSEKSPVPSAKEMFREKGWLKFFHYINEAECYKTVFETENE